MPIRDRLIKNYPGDPITVKIKAIAHKGIATTIMLHKDKMLVRRSVAIRVCHGRAVLGQRRIEHVLVVVSKSGSWSDHDR